MTFNRFDKKYLKIALPAAMEGVFMILLSNVDIIMVGTLGTAAIAAVSIFTQPRMMILCVARSFGSVVTLLSARHFGAGNIRNADRMLGQSLWFGGGLLLVLHVLFFLYLENILLWMGAENEYLAEAMVYGNIALAGVFLTSLTAILQALMIGFGQTGAVLKTNLQGNLLNALVNALLIFGLGPFPALGVKGAAIGTVAGTFYTLLYTLWVLRQDGLLRNIFRLPDRAYFREFLPVFGGVFSEQGFERIGMVLYTRMTAELGTLPYAVHAICMNFCDFYYSFAGGLGKASMALAGQAEGSGNPKAWQKYYSTGLKWSLLFSSLAFLLTFFLREEIFSVYSQEPEALALGSIILIYVAAVSFPEGHAMVCAGVLRGSGKTTQVAVYSFLSITLLRPLLTAYLLYTLNLGLTGAWIALAVDQTIRAGCSYFIAERLKRKKASCHPG